MQMRSRRMSCRAYSAENRALFDMLTVGYYYLLRVTVKRPVTVAVVDYTVISVTAAAAAAVVLTVVVRTGI